MVEDGVLTISDPTWEPPAEPGTLAKRFGPLIRDERDLPFIRLSLVMTTVFLPLAVVMFIPGMFRWWMAPVYWVLYLWFLGPFVLMLHCTSHRPLFKRKYKWLNKYIPWVLGIFEGQSPDAYFAHHLGMHHVEGNLPSDLSTTMPYQRDSFVDFLKYFLNFLLLGDIQTFRYLWKRRRKKMLRLFGVGESAYLLMTAALLVWNWRPALVIFVVPLMVTRLLLMMGNWAQHAFVDPDDPTNDWCAVPSFINSPYNHRCFNDGYHLSHHLRAGLHWLDLPADLLAKRERMRDEDSLVFRKIDYLAIFWLLMFKRHRRLATYCVQLDPERPVSEDEFVALIRKRVRRFDSEQLAAVAAGVQSQSTSHHPS